MHCCFYTIPSERPNLLWKLQSLCCKDNILQPHCKPTGGCEFDTKKAEFGWGNTLITHIVQVVVDGQKHRVLDCEGVGQA